MSNQDVATTIRELLRDHGSLQGGQLALLIRDRHPGWQARTAGSRKLRTFIETFVDGVAVVGRSGTDHVYGLVGSSGHVGPGSAERSPSDRDEVVGPAEREDLGLEMADLSGLDDALMLLIDRTRDPVGVTDVLMKHLCTGGETSARATDVDLRVAALLRIAAADADLLHGSPLRREALQIIRERLEESRGSLAEEYGIGRRTQADEMCRHLSRIYPDALRRLADAVDLYHGLDSLVALRQKVLNTLANVAVGVAIVPFIDVGGHVVDVFNSCFASSILYVDSGAGAAKQNHDAAIASITSLRAALVQNGTEPSRLLEGLIGRVQSDLEEHFAESPFSKPASFSLDAGLRRHPLHVLNTELAMPVSLRNDGSGVAIDVEVRLGTCVGVRPTGDPIRLSNVPPGSMIVEVLAATEPGTGQVDGPARCEIEVSWVDPDGAPRERTFLTELLPQDPDVDWEALLHSDPYSLEAVSTKEHLIGRSQMLARVSATVNTATIGSLYIYGQKRVGKTSIAKVVLTEVEESGAIGIFRDIGGINDSDPSRAVDKLVSRLVSDLRRRVPDTPDVRDLRLDGSIAPLVEVLETVAGQRPIVIALDEFDRLPAPLFRRTAASDAFFTGLRSISTIDGVGLVLIGGERMKFIINGPGVELNRFSSFPVDYLDRSNQWSEFEDLVRNPTLERLEFTDAACERIYDLTSGNPYYTKLVCRQILTAAAQRRDAFVDSREVDVARAILVGELDASAFAHYWEDFLLEEDDDRRDEVTLNRRRCLLAIGDVWAEGSDATASQVVAFGAQHGLDARGVERELRELADRGILVRDDDKWRPRVELFRSWIAERGHRQIVLTSTELEAAQRAMEHREGLRVALSEADVLASRFGSYRGRFISGERILEYLRQFGSPARQRLIFDLLRSVRFVNEADEQKLHRESFELLQQALKNVHSSWSMGQVAVTYAGAVGKSSLAMARAFMGANSSSFRRGDVQRPADIGQARTEITDIVVLDDFVGTGDSLSGDLQNLAAQCGDHLNVHLFVLAAVTGGLDRVRRQVETLFGDRGRLHAHIEVTGGLEGLLGSGVFESEEAARDALGLAEEFGRRLEHRAPLGYGDCCAPIVFSRTIPNNAPAILWSASTGAWDFLPLFPRNAEV